MKSLQEIREILQGIARQYPAEQVSHQLGDVDRIAFHVSLVGNALGFKGTLCDVGGGLGLFSVGCAAVGMTAILVDDFHDASNKPIVDACLEIHRRHGVTISQRDVVREGLEAGENTLDAVTSFDSMEHWHHSPKKLFHQIRGVLKPGGFFILGVPNCVNLRKRITVPLGRGKWTTMKSWYEPEEFRSHVREPDVDDLHYIARDMQLSDVQILGRNWLGLNGNKPAVRVMTRIVDPVLRLRPTLCSDIYMVGRKPA